MLRVWKQKLEVNPMWNSVSLVDIELTEMSLFSLKKYISEPLFCNCFETVQLLSLNKIIDVKLYLLRLNSSELDT